MGQLQTTISKGVEFKGKGLHLGLSVCLKILPAEENTGLIFRLKKGGDVTEIPANIKYVHNVALRTALSKDGVTIHTIEHVLASLYGLGISNAIIEMDEIEPPACDGSAQDFCKAILKAGIKEQKEEKQIFNVKEPITVRADGETQISLLPLKSGLKVSFSLEGEGLPSQYVCYEHSQDHFMNQVAPARTFCREFEVDKLKETPDVGEGAGVDNTLIVKLDSIAKDQKIPNELAHHKILDLFGDLSLFGKEIQGHIVCHHSGHSSNHLFVNRLQGMEEGSLIDIKGVREILPHSYPFLLVDKVLGYKDGEWVLGLKNVTINESFFQGHFPGEPIMPGVLILEALAQTGAVMLYKNRSKSSLAVFAGADKVKFRHRVVPGDQLRLEVKAKTIKSKVGLVQGVATVGGEIACQAEMKFMIVEN